MNADKRLPLTWIAKVEAMKIAPVLGFLSFYGLTLQEWTLLFGCLYAAGMLGDLVVRRWLYPLWKFLGERRREVKANGNEPT
ncbi:hypothetical protein [Pseudomonas viridiflava]|uniref:hypothetical protein n=1 Tax=Pseudomonas viridiflava TaxID=33069 RepID=UPI000F0493CC|nr:hypothetical protein [Pseudomonas viridiflava]